MKESFILLHKSLSSEKKIELSEGVSTSASDLLNDLFSKAPRIFNLEEQGVDTEEGQKKSVEEKVKDAIRKLPVHERKTDIEFEEFWGKYKRDYMEGSETTEAK
jgi:hypothetical protein